VNWEQATKDYDPSGKTKTESFKTYMSRTLKKIDAAKVTGNGNGSAGGEDADGAKGKKGNKGQAAGGASGGGKRKKAADDEEGKGAEVEQPKVKRGRKPKTVVKSEESKREAGAGAKKEGGGDEMF